jgi:hypothetical protein|tara:strand:+ start:752 stop:1084 length:333 start_codon:yes stop_codon:yes gene_type:complete
MTQNTEERINGLEAQSKQCERDLSVMSQALAEFLAWTQETEAKGIKPGTLKTAHNIVRMGHLKTEATTLRLTLEKLGNGASLPNIRETLQTRVSEIESQIAILGESCESA